MTVPEIPADAVQAATRAVLDHPWGDWPRSAHAEHVHDAGCAVCRRDVPAVLAVAAPSIAEHIAREAFPAGEGSAASPPCEPPGSPQAGQEVVPRVVGSSGHPNDSEALSALRERIDDAMHGHLCPDCHLPRAVDAVMDAIGPEQERLREELETARAAIFQYENTIAWNTTCHGCASALDAAYAETVRAEKAEAAIARVRELHPRDDSSPHGPWCGTCLTAWPCPTIRALDGPAVSERQSGTPATAEEPTP